MNRTFLKKLSKRRVIETKVEGVLPLAAAEGEAHENGITESKALRNLRLAFNLLNTTPTGAHSALFTRAAGGGLL